MSTPRSVRFDAAVERWLTSYVGRHAGASVSSVVGRLVDEGCGCRKHPGVLFPDGAAGQRAVMIGGPDVWEAVRAVRSARAAEPELLALVSANTGVPLRLVRTAVAYWAAYPEEVDAQIGHADEVEGALAAASARAHCSPGDAAGPAP